MCIRDRDASDAASHALAATTRARRARLRARITADDAIARRDDGARHGRDAAGDRGDEDGVGHGVLRARCARDARGRRARRRERAAWNSRNGRANDANDARERDGRETRTDDDERGAIARRSVPEAAQDGGGGDVPGGGRRGHVGRADASGARANDDARDDDARDDDD